MAIPTLLVVEDNPTLQKMVSLMAKRRGVPVTIVGTANDALAQVSQNEFGLILMDWSLPDRNGLECTALIREHLGSTTPIVAMTGHVMEGDREECLSAGMNDYLSKPFTFAQFNELIDRWLMSNATEDDLGDNVVRLPDPSPADERQQPPAV